MSALTSETSVALAAVAFEDMYTWDLGQVRVRAATMVPTVCPETYLEVLECLLERRGMTVAHLGVKILMVEAPENCFVAIVLILIIYLFLNF